MTAHAARRIYLKTKRARNDIVIIVQTAKIIPHRSRKSGQEAKALLILALSSVSVSLPRLEINEHPLVGHVSRLGVVIVAKHLAEGRVGDVHRAPIGRERGAVVAAKLLQK